MPCQQCNKPALFTVGDNVPVCIDCFHKLQSALYMQFLQNAAMMNQALDDMDSISGFSAGGGRIPVAEMAKAMQKGSVYNNIKISNSTVGVLNTGDLARIDAVITLTKDTDADDVGKRIKELTQAVIDTTEMDKDSKKEMIDLIQSLAEQIIGAQGGRKKSVSMAILTAIEERAKGIAAIYTLAKGLCESAALIFAGTG